MKATLILLAIAAFCFLSVSAQTDLSQICEDEFVRFGVHPDDCSRHFACMLGQVIEFQCPEGRIFVEEMRYCIYGDVETCVAEV